MTVKLRHLLAKLFFGCERSYTLADAIKHAQNVDFVEENAKIQAVEEKNGAIFCKRRK